ncbi:LuxR family transcriptional regulator [Sphingosinicella sp. BN140058]|uniref:LuxR family transcriptional regulator n=1 Tax=Sphingosinicella sp. BN140058 TaxID=1892855 RepID=UPI0013EA257F|nr:LuxR family transcriptional regulator [Sphingosinicella sp. BN140058]
MRAVRTEAELGALLAQITRELGFVHFALIQHVDMRHPLAKGMRLHNYPPEWERHFDEQQLVRTDPVHRACQVTAVGFAWSQLPTMIRLTSRDRRLLETAALYGLGDGYTVPAHVPGEVNGSCTFAASRRPPLLEQLAAAQLVGAYAFETARILARAQDRAPERPPHVSDRERECLIWVARGKSDGDIATILGISPETVHQYVKQARASHDVVSRSQLVAHALFNGTITYQEVLSG